MMGVEFQGLPKQIKPQVTNVNAQAKCLYCGLYGSLGRCCGCGAANQPVSIESRSIPVPAFDRVWK